MGESVFPWIRNLQVFLAEHGRFGKYLFKQDLKTSLCKLANMKMLFLLNRQCVLGESFNLKGFIKIQTM